MNDNHVKEETSKEQLGKLNVCMSFCLNHVKGETPKEQLGKLDVLGIKIIIELSYHALSEPAVPSRFFI